MKKLLISIFFGLSGAFLFAQGNYAGVSLHPQLGNIASPHGKGKARSLNVECNLGRELKKGKALETGIGIRQQRLSFRYTGDLEKGAGTYQEESTMLVAPARLRLHLNQRKEGQHQIWLNLGYIYGHRILADAWVMFDHAPDAAVRHELLTGGKNYHFAEFGLEMEAPIGQKYRIGLGINYTQAITTSGRSSYFNSNFQLPGIKIRFARRVW